MNGRPNADAESKSITSSQIDDDRLDRIESQISMMSEFCNSYGEQIDLLKTRELVLARHVGIRDEVLAEAKEQLAELNDYSFFESQYLDPNLDKMEEDIKSLHDERITIFPMVSRVKSRFYELKTELESKRAAELKLKRLQEELVNIFQKAATSYFAYLKYKADDKNFLAFNKDQLFYIEEKTNEVKLICRYLSFRKLIDIANDMLSSDDCMYAYSYFQAEFEKAVKTSALLRESIIIANHESKKVVGGAINFYKSIPAISWKLSGAIEQADALERAAVAPILAEMRSKVESSFDTFVAFQNKVNACQLLETEDKENKKAYKSNKTEEVKNIIISQLSDYLARKKLAVEAFEKLKKAKENIDEKLKAFSELDSRVFPRMEKLVIEVAEYKPVSEVADDELDARLEKISNLSERINDSRLELNKIEKLFERTVTVFSNFKSELSEAKKTHAKFESNIALYSQLPQDKERLEAVVHEKKQKFDIYKNARRHLDGKQPAIATEIKEIQAKIKVRDEIRIASRTRSASFSSIADATGAVSAENSSLLGRSSSAVGDGVSEYVVPEVSPRSMQQASLSGHPSSAARSVTSSQASVGGSASRSASPVPKSKVGSNPVGPSSRAVPPPSLQADEKNSAAGNPSPSPSNANAHGGAGISDDIDFSVDPGLLMINLLCQAIINNVTFWNKQVSAVGSFSKINGIQVPGSIAEAYNLLLFIRQCNYAEVLGNVATMAQARQGWGDAFFSRYLFGIRDKGIKDFLTILANLKLPENKKAYTTEDVTQLHASLAVLADNKGNKLGAIQQQGTQLASCEFVVSRRAFEMAK